MKHAVAFLMGAAVAVAAMLAIGNWQSTPSIDFATSRDVEELRTRVAGLGRALHESELKTQAEFERAKRSEEARAAEEAARRSAHVAALKAAQEAARRAEAEARKQAELVKQREAAAQKAREDAIKAAEAAKQARIPAPVAVPALAEAETLYQQAMAMESSGNARDAMRIYRRAARAGNGKAAKRLGDIFDCGVPGVRRDYAESLQWYEIAFSLGETVSTVGNRDGRVCPRAAQ